MQFSCVAADAIADQGAEFEERAVLDRVEGLIALAAQFQQAETFDISRKEASQHLAFGKGRHLCIGAPLARLETRIALDALYRRLPGLTVRPGQDFEYDPILLSVMLKSLVVEW